MPPIHQIKNAFRNPQGIFPSILAEVLKQMNLNNLVSERRRMIAFIEVAAERSVLEESDEMYVNGSVIVTAIYQTRLSRNHKRNLRRQKVLVERFEFARMKAKKPPGFQQITEDEFNRAMRRGES